MGDPGPFQNSVLYQYLCEKVPREWFICETCCANVVLTMVLALSAATSGGVGALRNAPRVGRMKEKIETETAIGDLMLTGMIPID
jgi:hypothetical protein